MSLGGIDLGTTTTSVAGLDPTGGPVVLTNDVGELFTPSVVYFESPGRILIGTEAKHMGLLDPSRCVEHFKRFMGTDTVLYTDENGKEYRAHDIAATLLGHARGTFEERTGEILAEAAVSVPANYTDAQKKATIDAAKTAGFVAHVTPHEPTCAAFGNQLQKRGDHRALLLDLGGGTFDVSVCEVSGNTVEILATGGEPQLGGADFTQRLVDHVIDAFEKQHGIRPTRDSHPVELQELHGRVEQVKISLSARDSASVLLAIEGKVMHHTITRDDFAALTRDLIDQGLNRAEATLQETGLTVNDLGAILPVGGAAKMPIFLDAVEKRFGRKPTSHADPFFAVGLGALVIGRIKKEKDGGTTTVRGRRLPSLDVFLRDRTAHAVGICITDDEHKDRNAVVLERGRVIPSDHTLPFQLEKLGQTSALIRVLQGADGALAEECTELGKFELKNLKPIHHEAHRIEIRLKIDDNGMLTAEAIDPASSVRESMQVQYSATGAKAA